MSCTFQMMLCPHLCYSSTGKWVVRVVLWFNTIWQRFVLIWWFCLVLSSKVTAENR